MNKLNIATLLISGSFLAGCAHPNDPIHESFGAATKANMAAQIIDSSPAGTGQVTADGARVTSAIERYKTDTVKQPEAEETSDTGESGS
jgi:hypothetical protein